jgi:hypothetical protein
MTGKSFIKPDAKMELNATLCNQNPVPNSTQIAPDFSEGDGA